MYEAMQHALPLGLVAVFLPAIIVFVLWSIAWKGYALWLAARNGHKWWFIALLVINTLAILEIIYIFAIGRPELKKREGTTPSPQNQTVQ